MAPAVLTLSGFSPTSKATSSSSTHATTWQGKSTPRANWSRPSARAAALATRTAATNPPALRPCGRLTRQTVWGPVVSRLSGLSYTSRGMSCLKTRASTLRRRSTTRAGLWRRPSVRHVGSHRRHLRDDCTTAVRRSKRRMLPSRAGVAFRARRPLELRVCARATTPSARAPTGRVRQAMTAAPA